MVLAQNLTCTSVEQSREPRNKPIHGSINLLQRRQQYTMEKRHSLFSKWCWESCTPSCKSMTLDYFPIPHTRSSRWLTKLNLRHDTIKLPEESTGKTFSNKNCTIVFSGQSPKAKAIVMKAKMNKWDLIKLTSFCTAKKTIKEKEKRTYRIGENICK